MLYTSYNFNAIFVNITINNKFNKYLVEIQNKRNDRIVHILKRYIREIGKWSEKSGIEMNMKHI